MLHFKIQNMTAISLTMSENSLLPRSNLSNCVSLWMDLRREYIDYYYTVTYLPYIFMYKKCSAQLDTRPIYKLQHFNTYVTCIYIFSLYF